MAGGEDYIPIRTALVDDPDVLALARALHKDRDLVVGKLVRFWSFAARVTPDGRLGPYTTKEIDEVVGCRGFCAALETFREGHADPDRRQGWLEKDTQTGELFIPKWDEWMSKSAKARAGEAVRKKLQRSGPDKCPDKRPDQRREEERREAPTPSVSQEMGGQNPAARAAVVRTGGGVPETERERYEALILAGVSPTKAREFVQDPFPTLDSIRRVRDTRKARDLPADNGLIGALKTAAEQDRIRHERRAAAAAKETTHR